VCDLRLLPNLPWSEVTARTRAGLSKTPRAAIVSSSPPIRRSRPRLSNQQREAPLLIQPDLPDELSRTSVHRSTVCLSIHPSTIQIPVCVFATKNPKEERPPRQHRPKTEKRRWPKAAIATQQRSKRKPRPERTTRPRSDRQGSTSDRQISHQSPSAQGSPGNPGLTFSVTH
jgi:hypothetical protein